MGIIITVANQKGGVGKTTTAINMSAALAEKGKKILLVDIDSQGNTTSGLGVEKNELENTTYELMLGEAEVENCLIHTEYKDLDILPSNVDMAAAEIELLDEEDREFKLRHILRPLKKQYDFIIVDCPPSLNILTVNAMTAADSILVPIQCEYYALEGLSQLLYTIELVKERLNPGLTIEGILFTMYDSRVRLSGQVVQNVKANLKERIFKTMIPRNVRLAEAPSHGKPVSLYARFSSGTRAYRNFAKELIALHANDPKEADEEEVASKDVYTDDILGLEENTETKTEAENKDKEGIEAEAGKDNSKESAGDDEIKEADTSEAGKESEEDDKSDETDNKSEESGDKIEEADNKSEESDDKSEEPGDKIEKTNENSDQGENGNEKNDDAEGSKGSDGEPSDLKEEVKSETDADTESEKSENEASSGSDDMSSSDNTPETSDAEETEAADEELQKNLEAKEILKETVEAENEKETSVKSKTKKKNKDKK